MRSKLSLRNFAIFVALVAVALVIGLYGSTNRSKTDGGNGGIALEPPFFISTAEASNGTTAFPTDKAGISAYVKLTTPIDIDKVRTIFTKVVDIGDNYIIGVVPIPNLGEDTDVHLYADMDGWLVAYLTQEEPAAKIMKWLPLWQSYRARRSSSNELPPQITEIQTTTLQDVLINAGRAAQVRIPTEIKYYDFEFPDANAITLFAKGVSKVTGAIAIAQLKIPAEYTLYEASYYHYVNYPRAVSGDCDFKVDEELISHTTEMNVVEFDSYKGAILPGQLHTIKISSNNPTEVTNVVATVLIYRTD